MQSTMQSSQPKQLYVYLSSEGIDSFIQYALVPAGIVGCPAFLHFIWTELGGTNDFMKVAINFGIAVSTVKLCRVVGSDIIFHSNGWNEGASTLQSQQGLSFILVVCCIALTFPAVGNNCYAVEFICFVMSLIGSILSEMFAHQHHNQGHHSSLASGAAGQPSSGLNSARDSNVGNVFNNNNSYYATDNKLRRQMTAFIFVTLLISLLFHEDANMTISKIQSRPASLDSPLETATLLIAANSGGSGATAAAAAAATSFAQPVAQSSLTSGFQIVDFMSNCRFYLYLLLSAFTLLMFLYHVYTGLHARPRRNNTDGSNKTLQKSSPSSWYSMFTKAVASRSSSQSRPSDSLSSADSERHPDDPSSSSTPKHQMGHRDTRPPLVITDQDLLTVPANFLAVCAGDHAKARAMYIKSLQWRHQYNVDEILTTPQEHFHEIIENYPHAIHGISTDNCVVLYEVLGKAKPRQLLNKGITTECMVWHFNLRNEFVFKKFKHLASTATQSQPIKPQQHSPTRKTSNPETSGVSGVVKIMTVVDVKGVSMYDFTTDVIAFIKQSSEVMDAYYPGHVERLVIVNAPSWFYSVWSVVTRVLPESVKKKIIITNDTKKLDDFIVPAQRPVLYGGTDVPLGQWGAHLEFLDIPKKWQQQQQQQEAATVATLTNSSSNNTDVIATTTNTELSTAATPSLWSWMSSKFQRNTEPSSKATTAYLGEKNQYKYDAETGSWMLDAPSEEENSDGEYTAVEGPDSGSSDSDDGNRRAYEDKRHNRSSTSKSKRTQSPAELEEHALLLAIQAAHYANLSNRSASRSKSATSSSNSDRRDTDGHVGRATKATNKQPPPAAFAGLTLDTSMEGYQNPQSNSRQRHTSSGATPMNASTPNAPTPIASLLPHNQLAVHGDIEAGSHQHPTESLGTQGAGGKFHMTSTGTGKATFLSTEVFLVVIGIFVLTASLHTSLLSSLPLWLYAPKEYGGGGYSVQNVALMCSMSAFMLLIADTYVRPRLTFILKSSPLRAIRIGCGTMIVATMLLPFFLTSKANQYHINVQVPVGLATSYLNASNSSSWGVGWFGITNTTITAPKLWTSSTAAVPDYSNSGDIPNTASITNAAGSATYSIDSSNVPSSPFSRTVAAFVEYWFPSAASIEANVSADSSSATNIPQPQPNSRFLTSSFARQLLSAMTSTSSPEGKEVIGGGGAGSNGVTAALEEEESIFHLIFPCLLLSVIVASSYLCRKASIILLQVALTPVFAEPKGLVRVVTNLVDIFIPALSCLIYSAIYDLALPYPMNALNFLSIAVCVYSLLYACTLLLDLKFLGDFGVIFDGIASAGSAGTDLATGHRDYHTHGNHNLGSQHSKVMSCCGCGSDPLCRELFSVPEEDLRLLFSRPKYGYGSKLYNLKLDVKDV